MDNFSKCQKIYDNMQPPEYYEELEVTDDNNIELEKICLFRKAVLKHHREKVEPCSGKTLDQCFTVEKNYLIFWYNIRDNTYAIKKEL